MNARARELGLAADALRQPDRPRRRRQPLERDRPRQAHADPAPQRVLPRDGQPASSHAAQRRAHRARSPTATSSSRGVGFVNGIKTGHTQQAGYVLVGSATRNGVTVLSAVLGDRSEAARNADTLALLRYGLEPLPDRHAGREAATSWRRVGLTHRDGESVELVAAATVRAHRAPRREARRARRGRADRDRRPAAAWRAARAPSIVTQRGKTVGRVPLVTATEVDAATVAAEARHVLEAQQHDAAVGRPSRSVASTSSCFGVARCAAARRAGGAEVA